MKIIKGDKVQVLIGKDKGRSGEVLKSLPKENKVVVKGLNIFKKHIKASQGNKGGIVEKERGLPVFDLLPRRAAKERGIPRSFRKPPEQRVP